MYLLKVNTFALFVRVVRQFYKQVVIKTPTRPSSGASNLFKLISTSFIYLNFNNGKIA
jgi:hypothetical protein